ncbi:carboxylesterase [Paenibacillus xylanexedens]|uniref:alpha/beta hydrolase n=1 Tax=Paenibacillus xylanexedens TaxID=528191 RepID=UPI00119CD75C|nr:alpha/beta hydrolase [Paenibacillus xylanexedens]
MNNRNEYMRRVEQKEKGTILWLTGWSMTDAVFDLLRERLPDYQHLSLDYSAVSTPEDMLDIVETTAKWLSRAVGSGRLHEGATHGDIGMPELFHVLKGACGENVPRAPLLISGWSMGAVLALGLAAKGYADGLVLFSATARFVRDKKELSLGVHDAYVRQMMRDIAKDYQPDVESRFRKMMFTAREGEMGYADRLLPAGCWTPEALLAGLQILRYEDHLPDLARIDCPVLLFHGHEDKICPYDAGVELLDRLPRARLVTLNDRGHAVFLGEEVRIEKEWRRWWHEHKQELG